MVYTSLVPKAFPFLPSFVFTIIHGSKELGGRLESIHHMSGREGDVGGRGQYSNMYILNLKASFLPIKTTSFDHTKLWSPKLR